MTSSIAKLPKAKSRYSKAHEKRRTKFGTSAFEALTKPTLGEFVRYCLKHVDNPYSGLALTSLLSGRSFTKLLDANQKIELTGQGVAKIFSSWEPTKHLTSTIPGVVFMPVEKYGYIVVPEAQATQVLEMREKRITAEECVSEFKSFLTAIRPTNGEKVTPERLAKALAFYKHEFGISSFEWAFIADEGKTLFAQNSYVAFRASALLKKLMRFMSQFIDVDMLRSYVQHEISDDHRFGSQRALTRTSVKKLFSYIIEKLKSALLYQYDFRAIFNWYTIYVVHVLQFATLHRPSDDVFRTLQFFCFESNTVEIQDKNIESLRVIPICNFAARVLKGYRQYLEKLVAHIRFSYPTVAAELKSTLAGRANIFRGWGKEGLLEDFKSLNAEYDSHTLFRLNWHRHFVMTQLIDGEADRYKVATYSGHRLQHEHANERSKSTSFEILREISDDIESLISGLEIPLITELHEQLR